MVDRSELDNRNIKNFMADRWRRVKTLDVPEFKNVILDSVIDMDEDDGDMDDEESEPGGIASPNTENCSNLSIRERYHKVGETTRELQSLISSTNWMFKSFLPVMQTMHQALRGEATNMRLFDAACQKFRSEVKIHYRTPTSFSSTIQLSQDAKNVSLPIPPVTAGRKGRFKSYYETNKKRGKARVCGACGAKGHNARNRACPKYNPN